jgi:hypothetical protein
MLQKSNQGKPAWPTDARISKASRKNKFVDSARYHTASTQAATNAANPVDKPTFPNSNMTMSQNVGGDAQLTKNRGVTKYANKISTANTAVVRMRSQDRHIAKAKMTIAGEYGRNTSIAFLAALGNAFTSARAMAKNVMDASKRRIVN